MTSDDPEIDLIIENPAWDEVIRKIDFKAIFNLAQSELPDQFNQKKSLSLLLADDAKVQELNKAWRGKDKPTNILSFPYEAEFDIEDSEMDSYLGDLAMAYETICQEANDQNKPITNHIIHLFIHGILHLIGMTHDEDQEAQQMEAIEISILGKLGIPSPYEDIYE